MRVAVCLTGQWRAGSDLDSCRHQFLRTCIRPASLRVFRVDTILDTPGMSAVRQQIEQNRRCAARIRAANSTEGFDHVLRIRPDTITHAVPLSRVDAGDVWTYRPFWGHPGANARVKLNDVFMWFARETFDAFFLSDRALPGPSTQTACNFTGRKKDASTFECWLHSRARSRGIRVAWRTLATPSWVLHRRTSADRRARLAKVGCACAL